MNPALQALQAKFRTRCAGDRGALAQLAADGDSEGVRMLAHKLAGAAGTFGFASLSQAALLLEEQVAFGEPADPELVALVDGLLATVSTEARA